MCRRPLPARAPSRRGRGSPPFALSLESRRPTFIRGLRAVALVPTAATRPSNGGMAAPQAAPRLLRARARSRRPATASRRCAGGRDVQATIATRTRRDGKPRPRRRVLVGRASVASRICHAVTPRARDVEPTQHASSSSFKPLPWWSRTRSPRRWSTRAKGTAARSPRRRAPTARRARRALRQPLVALPSDLRAPHEARHQGAAAARARAPLSTRARASSRSRGAPRSPRERAPRARSRRRRRRRRAALHALSPPADAA